MISMAILLYCTAKMRTVFLLVIHLVLWTQNAESKEISPTKTDIEQLWQNRINFIKSTELENVDITRMLSFNDLWNKIKNSVTNAWNAIQDIANKTKQKINLWIADLTKRAEEVGKIFDAKLEVLKDKVNKLVQTIKETAGDVKQCIQEDKEVIQELLKQIAIRVTACISESIEQASVLDSYKSRLTLDDTEFMKEADKKINKCVQSVDDPEDCLNKVRGEIYDDIDHTENSIMETKTTARNLVDDALETISKCAADGIIEASAAITEEVIKIINCVIEQKENSFFLRYSVF